MFEQSFTPAVEQAEPVSDMVYAAAENDPEYDANDDPSLSEEHYLGAYGTKNQRS